MGNQSEMIIYQTEDGLTKVNVTFEADTVWLSLDQMAKLFQRDKSVISRHMADWAKHLDGILTSTGEKLLIGAGSVSHDAAMKKAEAEYKKYKNRVLSSVEKDYLQSVKTLGVITGKA